MPIENEWPIVNPEARKMSEYLESIARLLFLGEIDPDKAKALLSILLETS